MRPLRELARLLGPYGLISIGIALLCAVFYIAAVKPAEKELQAQQDASHRLKARAPASFQPVAVDNRADDLRRFYALAQPVSGRNIH